VAGPIIANRLPYSRWIQVTNRAEVPLEDVVIEIDTVGVGPHRRIEVGTIPPHNRANLAVLKRHEKVDGVRARYRLADGTPVVSTWHRAQGLTYFRWICLYLTTQGAQPPAWRTQEIF